jgi:hypothetical protein
MCCRIAAGAVVSAGEAPTGTCVGVKAGWQVKHTNTGASQASILPLTKEHLFAHSHTSDGNLIFLKHE